MYADYLAACDKLALDLANSQARVLGHTRNSEELVGEVVDSVWPIETRLALMAGRQVEVAVSDLNAELHDWALKPETRGGREYTRLRDGRGVRSRA